MAILRLFAGDTLTLAGQVVTVVGGPYAFDTDNPTDAVVVEFTPPLAAQFDQDSDPDSVDFADVAESDLTVSLIG